MAKITTPVKGFTGVVVGVPFADGQGETDDESAIAYFNRHGYDVEAAEKAVTIPDGAPSTDWKGDQLKAYAEKHELDLGSAKSKPELVAAIEAADKAKADAAQTAAGNTQE